MKDSKCAAVEHGDVTMRLNLGRLDIKQCKIY